MGRPPSDLYDYLEWQQKLQQFQESDLTVVVFCQQERISRSAFHRWTNQLKESVPESISTEATEREEAESTDERKQTQADTNASRHADSRPVALIAKSGPSLLDFR